MFILLNEIGTTSAAAFSNKIQSKQHDINANCAKQKTASTQINRLTETIFFAIEIVKAIIAFVLYRLNEFVMLIRMTGDLYKNNNINNDNMEITNTNSNHNKLKL